MGFIETLWLKSFIWLKEQPVCYMCSDFGCAHYGPTLALLKAKKPPPPLGIFGAPQDSVVFKGRYCSFLGLFWELGGDLAFDLAG